MTSQRGETLYNWLLDQETQGNDDRRFYASYLLGHVSLAIADSEDNPDMFEPILLEALESALALDKLSSADIEGIRALLSEAL